MQKHVRLSTLWHLRVTHYRACSQVGAKLENRQHLTCVRGDHIEEWVWGCWQPCPRVKHGFPCRHGLIRMFLCANVNQTYHTPLTALWTIYIYKMSCDSLKTPVCLILPDTLRRVVYESLRLNTQCDKVFIFKFPTERASSVSVNDAHPAVSSWIVGGFDAVI